MAVARSNCSRIAVVTSALSERSVGGTSDRHYTLANYVQCTWILRRLGGGLRTYLDGRVGKIAQWSSWWSSPGWSVGRPAANTYSVPAARCHHWDEFNSPSVVAFDSAVIGLRGDGVGAATSTPGCGCEVSKDTILTCTRKLAVKPA